MPYRLSGNCVQKETASGWETVKCHENTRKAQAHLDALNINVMTDEEKSGLFTRFLEWAKGLTQPDPAPLEANGFKVTGNRWFAWWSNNFEDRDGEIFTEAAIDDYVGRVKSGVTPYPELWFWHIPGTKHGQADYVGRVGHFAVAAGEFDSSPLAQSMKAHYSKGEWAVSHGFRYPPSQKQHGVYHHFTTFELSPLRPQAAANPYTEFNEVVKMQISPDAIAELKAVVGESEAARILQTAESSGKQLEQDTRYKSAAERSEESVNADLAEVKAQLDTLLLARQQEAETSAQQKATNDRLASIEKTQADIARAMKQLTQLVAAEFEAQPPASKSRLTQVDAEDATVKEMIEAAKAAGKRKMSVLEKMTGTYGGGADDDDEEDTMMPRRGGKR